MTPHSPTPQDNAIERIVARHERALLVAWLALCVALLATMAIWGLVRNGAERAVDAASESWVRDLARAEELLEEGHVAHALAALERIDRDCPATFVKHRHDRERERLLAALASAYEADGRKRRALETLERAVAFDPKNFGNHFALAELARECGEDARARAAYAAVLAIHPTHLRSAEALMDMDFAGGEWQRVVATFERYIEAWQLATVHLRIGADRIALDVPVDGIPRALDAACAVAAPWSGTLALQTHGYSVRVLALAALPPLRAGESPRAALGVPIDARWSATGCANSNECDWIASGTDASIESAPLDAPDGIARVRLELALFRTVSAPMWKQAEQSFANCLLTARWRELSARLRQGGAPEAGSVFSD
ncbi:MAG: hypothetical protein FJ298_09355 [Planctomycetes bacterium]|nr:hypothetical protein [Planctomycetota bacterium]